MKKKHPAGDGSLGWALSVLSIAFASLAISVLLAQNNELSERVMQLEEQVEQGETSGL